MRFSKDTGPKPAKTLLKEASRFAKTGTKDHMAVALYLRPNGATQTEVIKLLDHPHRNKIKKLLQDNKVRQTVLPDGSRSTRVRLIVNKR